MEDEEGGGGGGEEVCPGGARYGLLKCCPTWTTLPSIFFTSGLHWKLIASFNYCAWNKSRAAGCRYVVTEGVRSMQMRI